MHREAARTDTFKSQRFDSSPANSAWLFRKLRSDFVRNVELNLHDDLLFYYPRSTEKIGLNALPFDCRPPYTIVYLSLPTSCCYTHAEIPTFLALIFSLSIALAQTPTLGSVHRIFIDKMPNDLDQYLKAEFVTQMKKRITIVLDEKDADAIITGVSEEEKGTGAKITGRYLGLHDLATASLSLVDKDRKMLLWSAGDRSLFFSVAHRGGERKVADPTLAFSPPVIVTSQISHPICDFRIRSTPARPLPSHPPPGSTGGSPTPPSFAVNSKTALTARADAWRRRRGSS
jgi:hypothetical protein